MTSAVMDKLATGPAAGKAVAPRGGVGKAGVLVDMTRCIGCKACVVACKEWHELPYVVPPFDPTLGAPPLSATAYTTMQFEEIETADGAVDWAFAKHQCMHCEHPTCASACPVQALEKTAEGAVVYDSDLCMGCRYCMLACPFNIPKFQWGEINPEIAKCDFCADRIQAGLTPSCAAACPTETIQFGDREELLAEAKARIAAEPGKYVPHIYGEHENGGTSWVYLSSVPFAELGFPEVPDTNPAEHASRQMLAVPVVAGVGLALFGGAVWFTRRKQAVANAAAESQPTASASTHEGEGSNA